MKALLQRVAGASVRVAGRRIARIGPGLVVLLGVRRGDREADAEALAARTADLRIFPDGAGRMNRSIRESGGEILAVSQFTLYADTRRGRRPGFSDAAPPAEAEPLYDGYVRALRRELGGDRVRAGRFAAEMRVTLVNDGPVTVELSTDAPADAPGGRPASPAV